MLIARHRCAAVSLALLPAAVTAQSVVPRVRAERMAVFAETFSQVRGVRELSSGKVLVTDWVEERLAVLESAGGSAIAVGRVGSGPQEYRLPAQLLPLPGDSTLLVDQGNARLAVVGPDLTIRRTMPARAGGAPYEIAPRGVDADGDLYFVIPPWTMGPNAPTGDSADLARWDPRRDNVVVVARLKGAERPSWQREGRPRRTPGIPMVAFAPQDAWAVAPDGRIAVVRAADYHVEWLHPDGAIQRGPAYAYPPLPVTEADKRAFVRTFLESSPMSGRGEGGGLGHTPAEFRSPERIEEAIRTNEFADRLPYFRAGGAWIASDGGLWVERSAPHGGEPVLDVFDEDGTLRYQVLLPRDRRVVGFGRGVLYAVMTDTDGLETLERYRLNLPSSPP
jgi:hypothetical protein